MNADEIINQLRKRQEKKYDFKFHFNVGVSEDEIFKKEEELNINIPEPTKYFYKSINGFSVQNPKIIVLSLAHLYIVNGLIHFATINSGIKICFDVTDINVAGQWNIVNCKNRYEITKTMSSFWSNKIWKWIDREVAFWKEM